MSNTHTTKSHCRACKTEIFPDPTYRPKEHDISVCQHCGTISTYNEDLNLAPLTEEELTELQEERPALYADITNTAFLIRLHNAQH